MKKTAVFQLPWKTRIFLAAFLILIAGTGAVTFVQYRDSILWQIERQTEESLENVSAQNVQLAQNWMADRQRLLRAVAEEMGGRDKEDRLKMLKSFADAFGFYSMGVIDGSGIGHTTLGETLELGEKEYVRQALEGKEVLTEERLSENKEERLHIFAVPVEGAGEEARVLTAVYRTEDFLEMLNIRSYSDQGGSLVVNASGDLVSRPSGEAAQETAAIEDYLKGNFWKPPAQGETTISRTGEEGEGFLLCTQSLPFNDWSLMTYVKEASLNETAEILSRKILYILFFLYFVILLLSALYAAEWRRYRKKMAEALFTDSITGEWNEQYFRLCCQKGKPEWLREKWVVCFDVDRFKLLNLLYGVQRGDAVLQTISRVFHRVLPQEELYHSHLDIFLAVLAGKKEQEIREKLKQFQEGLADEMEKGDIPRFSVSFGVCSFQAGRDLDSVCANAGFARQEAKEQLTDKCRFYGDKLSRQLESGRLEMRFEEAVRKEEFQIWYQPKYDLRTGKISGAEALVRWKEENGGLIPPSRFIPVFESTGQIVELDEMVVRLVCRDIRASKERGLEIGNISVNLSKLHVVRPGITEKIGELAENYGIEPAQLSFEITESAAEGEDRAELVELVSRLQEMGFAVHMDDYGTGSSTLRSLADTHFDVLKLDRSFVSLAGDSRVNIILTSTIQMARLLGMEVVAEGVETKEQAEFLRRNGCHTAQGYYFSRPLCREEFFGLAKKGGTAV